MNRRQFITLLGGAGLLFTQVTLNAGVARSEVVVDRLLLPASIEFSTVKLIGCRGVLTRRPLTSRNICPLVKRGERFRRMVLIEATVRGVDVNGAVAAQVNMLNKRKSANPTVNFAVSKNPITGEIILDFILSAHGPRGKTSSSGMPFAMRP